MPSNSLPPPPPSLAQAVRFHNLTLGGGKMSLQNVRASVVKCCKSLIGMLSADVLHMRRILVQMLQCFSPAHRFHNYIEKYADAHAFLGRMAPK